MKGLELSHFKKVHEDDHTATLVHPQGHQIKIAKKVLTKGLKKQLSALPMADGGEVPDEELPAEIMDDATASRSPASEPAPAPESFAHHIGSSIGQSVADAAHAFGSVFSPVAHSVSDFAQGMSGSQAVAAPQPDTARMPADMPSRNPVIPAAPAPVTGMPQVGMAQDMVQGGINQVQKGYQQGAQAQGALGQEQSQLAQAHIESLKNLQGHYEEEKAKNEGEIKGVLKDIDDGHINPDHYWESKSSGGKVSTAIGLILGGLGSGLTGQPNMAMQFLNHQIERDVDAQKANLGKKNTLLSAYMHQTGNIRDAYQLATATQAAIYANEIEKAKAKAQSPMAKAEADKAIGTLKAQYGPVLEQYNLRRAAMRGAAAGNVDPGFLITAVVPDKHQEQAMKELQAAQNHAKQHEVIMSAFDSANQENTLGNRALHGGFEPASVARLQTAMMPYLKDAEGRINESELARTDALIPKPGDAPKKIQEKKMALEQFMEEKAARPLLDAYHIPYPKAVPSSKFTRRPGG